MCRLPRTAEIVLGSSDCESSFRDLQSTRLPLAVTPGVSSCEESARIETHLQAARNAGATTEILQSDDPVSAIGEFATQKRITQIFIGHGSQNNWRDRLFGDPILRLIRASDGIDVRVFPQ